MSVLGACTDNNKVYVGDTATLSFLQLIRMMVESTMGPSTFTTDPRRHRLTENILELQPKQQMTHLLPDKQTTTVLVKSFFINANLIQVFDEKVFLETLDKCYSSPLFVDPSWLCLLNLVLAIGLVLATPTPGGPEAELVDTLRGAYKCDIFFFNAKHLNDPIIGFEDADFWSVQALLLMAMYMLCRSKRNSAFAYIGRLMCPTLNTLRSNLPCEGMAVRSAYALGLHREETLVVFPPAEQHIRQQVWRSLFVMDRFLAISLGRPPAINEEDCSGDALNPPPTSPDPTPTEIQFYHSGLEAGVRCCHILSIIIKEIYQKRKVSTKTAQEIAERCKLWPKTLPPTLHWRQASPSNPRQGITILHVNMLYCHAVILFTRPFFLYLLSLEMQRKYFGSNQDPRPRHGKMEKFSEACIIASLHTIALIQNACDCGYLPKQNPFVIYCLFSAALVILTGKLTSQSTHEASDQSIDNAISILSYCGKMDAQAARIVQILNSFRDVIFKQTQNPQQSMSTTLQLPSVTPGSFPQVSPFVQQMTSPSHGLPTFTTAPQPRGPDPTISAPPPIPSFSLPPSHPTSTSPATTSPNPALRPPSRLPYIRTDSFSGLLDLDNADHLLGNTSDESSGADNEIDFNSLWSWPGAELGTPGGGGGMNGNGGGGGLTPGGSLNLKDLGVQGVSDSAVPLFGTLETAAGES